VHILKNVVNMICFVILCTFTPFKKFTDHP